MTHRLSLRVSLGFILVIALLLPTASFAQDTPPVVLEERGGRVERSPFRDHVLLHRGKRWEVGATAGAFGPGFWHAGYPYGPRVAPPWSYYGLGGGPFIGYPWWGWPGYSGAAGDFWTNGLSLYGPPVPVYGPIPGVFGNNDLTQRWRDWPGIGLPFGWVGIYAASPRPRPLTVNARPTIESVPLAHGAPPVAVGERPPEAVGGMLILSVKLPQPAAEVFVDGVKTMQTGTDRIFESPPLEAGKQFKYEITARWIEGGTTREVKKAVVGTPGEVVRVDFTTGN